MVNHLTDSLDSGPRTALTTMTRCWRMATLVSFCFHAATRFEGTLIRKAIAGRAEICVESLFKDVSIVQYSGLFNDRLLNVTFL